jgi:hypothetical protein
VPKKEPPRIDKPKFTITAEKLLMVLQAVTPLASKDKDRPHLTQLRFEAGVLDVSDGDALQASATDGRALARVTVPLTSLTAPVVFCVQATHVPTILRMLARLDSKRREELDVSIEVGRHQMRLTVADASVYLPRNEEQLSFPDIESAIPKPYTPGRGVAPRFGMSPTLMAKVMNAASHVASAVKWTAPETELHPTRLDIVEALGVGVTGTYIVAPMRIDLEDEKRRREEESDDRQPELPTRD